MKNCMRKRIEKLEAQTESLKAKSGEKQEVLLKLEQIEDKDSQEALLLKMKLAFMSGLTFAEMVRRAARAESEAC
jgi:hypothetical protein